MTATLTPTPKRATPQRATAPRNPATRIGRIPTRSLTDIEERQRLVRAIAADPIKLQWLREHDAALLRREADRLARAGHYAMAAQLAARADLAATGTLED